MILFNKNKDVLTKEVRNEKPYYRLSCNGYNINKWFTTMLSEDNKEQAFIIKVEKT